MVSNNKIDRLAAQIRAKSPGLNLRTARLQAKAALAHPTSARLPFPPTGIDIFTNGTPLERWNLPARWQRNATSSELVVPIGYEVDQNAQPLDALAVLTLHPDGDRQGLMVGIAGCGKSYLASQIVFQLAANYPPSRVNIAALDSALFDDDIARLPHTHLPRGALAQRWILEDDDTHTSVITALLNELDRRRTILHNASVSSAAEYRSLSSRTPLPDLVILTGHTFDEPDFGERRDHVWRLLAPILSEGAHLGVYLLMGPQTTAILPRHREPDFDYRIAFHLLAQESRSVIGTNQARDLPIPGAAYLSYSDGTAPVRINTFNIANQPDLDPRHHLSTLIATQPGTPPHPLF